MMEPTPAALDVSPSLPAVHPETANRLTHGLGFALSLAAAAVLMSTAMGTGDPYRVAGCAVYALSLVALYAASTLSHSFDDARRRDFFRMVDQICIFLLVVGTYTPFGLVHARDGGWWVLLAAMWMCAFTGIGFRIRNGNRSVPAMYFVLMGWLPLLTLSRAYEIAEVPGLTLVLFGGLAYCGGIWFLKNDHRHPYFHAVWHLCTIAGSALHYVFLLEYVAAPTV